MPFRFSGGHFVTSCQQVLRRMTDEKTQRTELRLIPTRITLEANLKLFGLDSGRSAGSSITVEFSVPEGVDPEWVQQQTLREKEKLDLTVAAMELARGSLTREDYDKWRAQHRKAYDGLLKRRPEDEKNAGRTGD